VVGCSGLAGKSSGSRAGLHLCVDHLPAGEEKKEES